MPALALLLLSAASSQPAQVSLPKVLVVQRSAATVAGADGTPVPPENVPVAGLLAGELEATDRVRTVVWGTTDAVFRAAVDEGRVKPSAVPDEPEIRRIGKSLGCRFVLMVICSAKSGVVTAEARLIDANGRTSTASAREEIRIAGNADLNLGAESIARSLTIRLEGGGLKDLPKRPNAEDVPASPGQIAAPPATSQPAAPRPPLADVVAQADRLIGEGRLQGAILLLRDGVDADPFDPARRLALIRVLRKAGLLEQALSEARAALAITPDGELIVESARALIAAGRGDEAKASLNEALARNPADPQVRRLLGELAMREGDPARALGHLDAILATTPDAATYRLRAVCRGLLGGAEGVALDLKRATELEPSGGEPIEGDAFEIVDAALVEEGPTLRLLFQKAILRRDSSEVAEGIDSQERLATALLELSRLAGTTVRYADSRESRVLALSLVRQSMGELRAYLASGKEDDLADARITLGEALKNLTVAREAHLALRKADARPR